MLKEAWTRRAFGQLTLSPFILPLLPRSAEASGEQWVPHWDGTWKRVNNGPGIKFILIPGMGSSSRSDNTFRPITEDVLYPLGFDEYDLLPMPYKLAERIVQTTNGPVTVLGDHFSYEDSTQYPPLLFTYMDAMMRAHKKNFRNGAYADQYVVLGYSQGGLGGYELARRHPDAIKGVISLDGALKGADIVPTDVDRGLAPLIGGEAAQFLLERASDLHAHHEVEMEIARLRQTGMIFVTFASTDDQIIPPHLSFAESSDKKIGGRTLQTRFSMEEWRQLRAAQEIPEEVAKQLEQARRLSPQPPVAMPSGQLRPRDEELLRRVRGGFYGHAAVLKHPRVLAELTFVLEHMLNRKASIHEGMNAQKDLLRQVGQLLQLLSGR
jgi:pimeloyl-ACP methyl ester carboxylesterase